MSVFGDEWIKVDNPDSDSMAYVNPEADVMSQDPFRIDTESLRPDGVENDGWDVIEQNLSAPEAVGVDGVGLNFDNGLIGVYDSKGLTSYVLGAIGDDGGFAVVDSNGNVSDSATNIMSAKHNAAVVEAIHGYTESEEFTESSVGFETATDIYDEIVDSGEYEALNGDVVYSGFDSVEGASEIAGDERKASGFVEELENIAEFYRDFEEGYGNSGFVDLDLPTVPMRNGRGYYKFRVPDTGNDVSLVVDRQRTEEDVIELDVKAFGGHDSDVDMY